MPGANGTTESALAPIIAKHQSEIEEVQRSLSAIQKDLNRLKPAVEEYEAKMKYRKDLRRELTTRQRAVKTVAEFFKGMTLFDERFPLFAGHPTEPRQTTTPQEKETA